MNGPEKTVADCYFNFHIQDNGIFQENKGSLGNQKHGVTSNNRFLLFLHINQFFLFRLGKFSLQVFFFRLFTGPFLCFGACSGIFAVRMRKSSKYCCFVSRNSMRRKKKLSNIYNNNNNDNLFI